MAIFGILAIGASAAGIYWNYNRPQGDLAVDGQATGSPEKSLEKSVAVNDAPKTPKYKGQALDLLASSKELANYPKEFVEVQRAKLAGILNLIKENPNDETNWIDMGLVKKVFNNFTGARDAWEYAKLLNPGTSMAHYNLGKLYSAYLPDNQKAQANFL